MTINPIYYSSRIPAEIKSSHTEQPSSVQEQKSSHAPDHLDTDQHIKINSEKTCGNGHSFISTFSPVEPKYTSANAVILSRRRNIFNGITSDIISRETIQHLENKASPICSCHSSTDQKPSVQIPKSRSDCLETNITYQLPHQKMGDIHMDNENHQCEQHCHDEFFPSPISKIQENATSDRIQPHISSRDIFFPRTKSSCEETLSKESYSAQCPRFQPSSQDRNSNSFCRSTQHDIDLICNASARLRTHWKYHVTASAMPSHVDRFHLFRKLFWNTDICQQDSDLVNGTTSHQDGPKPPHLNDETCLVEDYAPLQDSAVLNAPSPNSSYSLAYSQFHEHILPSSSLQSNNKTNHQQQISKYVAPTTSAPLSALDKDRSQSPDFTPRRRRIAHGQRQSTRKFQQNCQANLPNDPPISG